jgi:uncharacterized protein YndB with AHSA1/START domain
MPRSSEARDYAPEEVLEIVRTFDAPRGLVWRLWSEPEHRLRWWGPEGMALTALEMDFREGGAWRMVMRHVGGYEHPVHGVFVEVKAPSRLSFTYVNDSDMHETLVTMDLVDHGTQTEMRFRQAPFTSVELRDAHGFGWGSTFDLLDRYAPLVPRVEPRPVGEPRTAGTAPDMVAAQERWDYELVHGFKGKWNPGDPR